MMSYTAYYDLMVNPASYDIVSFLMLAERKRLEKGADGVEIQILPGPWEGFRRDGHWPYTVEERRNMLNRVVIPMCHLLPSCVGVELLGKRVDKVPDSIGHSEYTISFKEFSATYANACRPLRAGDVSYRRKLISITLRESEHWPERNSNTAEWLEAARRLKKHGYEVIVLRDAILADDPLGGDLVSSPDASRDLKVRASLYASAALNLFVNNGPTWFALALDAPALVFRPITETSCWAHTAEAMKTYGIVAGQQMKGAPPYQRLCWLPEQADNIVEQIESFVHEPVVAA